MGPWALAIHFYLLTIYYRLTYHLALYLTTYRLPLTTYHLPGRVPSRVGGMSQKALTRKNLNLQALYEDTGSIPGSHPGPGPGPCPLDTRPLQRPLGPGPGLSSGRC